ncbi:GTP-binding protein [Agromyces sp. Soil535]|nr:GTP-binding protein [Agromyces sp. Soil535]
MSHTNAGKTTLARTLLGRDVGEVRDAPHVTAEATPYPLVQTADGDLLTLWDTPGFGDSVRLARRLRQDRNPIGWFLSQVWDRYQDRVLWLSQLAVRNVAEQADVVLYLVNAAEAPADAGYLASELEVLEWIGKPVLVLLNQTGPPRERAVEEADAARWRAALGDSTPEREVLAFDAFARCWVQEFTLFGAIEPLVPDASRSAFARLAAAWRELRMDEFQAAMSALAGPIARAAADRVTVPPPASESLAKRVGGSLGLQGPARTQARTDAEEQMAARLQADLRQGLERLIAIHRLEGRAAEEVLERVAGDVHIDAPLDGTRTAAVSGVVSGALTGLGADLIAGGLTFGAGMVAGAIIGALGGAGVAQGVNVVRGRTESSLRWEEAFLDGLVTSALLRYLAVAHYGRGRGAWRQGEYPPHWRPMVVDAVVAEQDRLAAIWGRRGESEEAVQRSLEDVLRKLALGLLDDLYPGALHADRSAVTTTS